MSQSFAYRSDIDGLRAIAILPVVLFHLGVTPFSGGFIGVDVFFVISGFLITGIVYKELQAGTFSYARFYERRIRRIFPALAAMLLLTGIVAWFLLLPADFKLFSEAQGLAVVSLANVHFWNKTDYFNDAVENIPLLHTWSLSVEEQFYLFLPLVLVFLLRIAPRHVNLALLGFALLSLIWAQVTVGTAPESAFYLVHLRAWELLAGALLATGLVKNHRLQWVRELSALLGVSLVFASIFMLDKDTPFPGISAFPAVLGTALVLHAGMSGSTRVGKLLSGRIFVFFGLISYSLYLWHWPVFVFAEYYKVGPLGPVAQLLLFVFVCLLGWFSWRFVEKPFRKTTVAQERRQFFKRAGYVAAVLILVSLPGIVSKGAAFRLPDSVVEVSSTESEAIPYRRPCFGLAPVDVDQERNICTLGAEGRPDFLLWGDSHALSLAHGYALAARERGRSGRFLARSECPPILGGREYRASSVSCSAFNESVVKYLDRHAEIRNVILVGVWSSYLRKDAALKMQEGLRFAGGLEKTLSYLERTGREVTIVEQVPVFEYNVPRTLARQIWYGRDIELRLPRNQHEVSTQAAKSLFDKLSVRYSIHRIDPANSLCDGEFCNVAQGGSPLYRDSNHLSRLGSSVLVPVFSAGLVEASNDVVWE